MEPYIRLHAKHGACLRFPLSLSPQSAPPQLTHLSLKNNKKNKTYKKTQTKRSWEGKDSSGACRCTQNTCVKVRGPSWPGGRGTRRILILPNAASAPAASDSLSRGCGTAQTSTRCSFPISFSVGRQAKHLERWVSQVLITKFRLWSPSQPHHQDHSARTGE